MAIRHGFWIGLFIGLTCPGVVRAEIPAASGDASAPPAPPVHLHSVVVTRQAAPALAALGPPQTGQSAHAV